LDSDIFVICLKIKKKKMTHLIEHFRYVDSNGGAMGSALYIVAEYIADAAKGLNIHKRVILEEFS
jgi:hypothetical protein